MSIIHKKRPKGELVTFLKFEAESLTQERIDKLTRYHKLVMIGIDEDMIVFRVDNKQ